MKTELFESGKPSELKIKLDSLLKKGTIHQVVHTNQRGIYLIIWIPKTGAKK